MSSSTKAELAKLEAHIAEAKTNLDDLAEQLKTAKRLSEANKLDRQYVRQLRQLQWYRARRNSIRATAELREDKDHTVIYGGSHNRHYQTSLAYPTK